MTNTAPTAPTHADLVKLVGTYVAIDAVKRGRVEATYTGRVEQIIGEDDREGFILADVERTTHDEPDGPRPYVDTLEILLGDDVGYASYRLCDPDDYDLVERLRRLSGTLEDTARDLSDELAGARSALQVIDAQLAAIYAAEEES